MPTNIVQASGKPVGESGWSTIGQGAQGLAALVGGLMQSQAADKAAKLAKGQATLDAAGYKTPGMDSLQGGGIAANPFAGGAGSGNLGTASLPSRPVEGMVQSFSSAPRSSYLDVGPSVQPPDLMKSLQMPGIASTFSPLQTMMTRNFPASTFQPFQYGGM